MTPMSPADRNKAIGLVIAVVAVFGFLLWRVLGVSAQTGQAAPVVHLSAETATTQVASTGALTTAQPRVVDVTVPPGASEIDPFRTVLSEPSKVGELPPAQAGRSTPPPPGMGLTGEVPGVHPVQPTVDIEPKLTGVVTGDDPVAIFLDGSNESILHVGDRLPTGYLIETIGRESVVLKRDGKRITLKVSPSQ